MSGFLHVSSKVSSPPQRFPVFSVGNPGKETRKLFVQHIDSMRSKWFPHVETVSLVGNPWFPPRFPARR
jgi:hypothetical protein